MTGASGDEANIAYLSACIGQAGVGFTRAIRELHLPRDFKGILTTDWQQAISQYESVKVLRTSKASPAPRKRAPREGLPGNRSGE